ncbi:MAG: phosphatidylserine decarboxylase [Candidatus Omnitrophica bacterium]|nr:phosphatidylserine decarboxylase [Candidatus Omnitrophota bacterium]
MRLPIDRRAWPGAFILAVLALVAGFIFWKAALCFVFLLAGHILFFRDPERRIPAGLSPVSPADGKVVDVSTVYEDRYLKENAVKIGIFLSIFNAHVSRAPVAGRVGYQDYVLGKFLNALDEESVIKNESNWIGIGDGDRAVLVRQIAGGIARRIFWQVKPGDRLERGERFGIICYGSRFECYLPERHFKPAVKKGQKVKAGLTILGDWTT